MSVSASQTTLALYPNFDIALACSLPCLSSQSALLPGGNSCKRYNLRQSLDQLPSCVSNLTSTQHNLPLRSSASVLVTSQRSSTCQLPLGSVDVGSYTLPGNRYAELNQDYMVVQELYAAGEIPRNGQQTYVVAICDGHGILGDKSACFAGKALARHLYSGPLRNKHLSRMDANDVQAEMKAAFKKANAAANTVYDSPPKSVQYPAATGSSRLTSFSLVDNGGVKLYRSAKGTEKMLECGTTCTAAIVQGRCVCIANVGDSAAVLGRDKGCSQWGAEVVTVKHSGKLAEEAQRISLQHASTTCILEDGYLQVHAGPWAGYELAVTRALGHKNIEQYGVMDEPYCAMLNVEPEHRCLVVASDGVWDVMEPAEVVTHVMRSAADGCSAAAAARALVQHAMALGMGSDLGEQDNTSAIVVLFRDMPL